MSTKKSFARVDFSALPATEQRALFEETVPSWSKIFGTPASDLEAYWFEKKSRKTIIYVLRDEAGHVQGTVTFKYYNVVYENRKLVIIKTGVGVVPEARGNNFTARSIATQSFFNAVQHPFDEVYVFSTLIHPVTYQIITTFLDTYYPYYDRAQDASLEKLVGFLVEHFALQTSENPNAFVFREVRSTVETPETRAYWRQKCHPAVRFFIEKCPQYADGECFIMLAPIRRRFLFTALRTFAALWLKRRWRGPAPLTCAESPEPGHPDTNASARTFDSGGIA